VDFRTVSYLSLSFQFNLFRRYEFEPNIRRLLVKFNHRELFLNQSCASFRRLSESLTILTEFLSTLLRLRSHWRSEVLISVLISGRSLNRALTKVEVGMRLSDFLSLSKDTLGLFGRVGMLLDILSTYAPSCGGLWLVVVFSSLSWAWFILVLYHRWDRRSALRLLLSKGLPKIKCLLSYYLVRDCVSKVKSFGFSGVYRVSLWKFFLYKFIHSNVFDLPSTILFIKENHRVAEHLLVPLLPDLWIRVLWQISLQDLRWGTFGDSGRGLPYRTCHAQSYSSVLSYPFEPYLEEVL
jgi:hypothetical protein